MLGAGENLAASIVEQHDVKFFGPIHFIRSSRAAYQCAVGGDGLSGSRRSQDWPKDREISEPRNYFLNARDRDMNARDSWW